MRKKHDPCYDSIDNVGVFAVLKNIDAMSSTIRMQYVAFPIDFTSELDGIATNNHEDNVVWKQSLLTDYFIEKLQSRASN